MCVGMKTQTLSIKKRRGIKACVALKQQALSQGCCYVNEVSDLSLLGHLQCT